MKKGDVVLLHSHTVHGSETNNSKDLEEVIGWISIRWSRI